MNLTPQPTKPQNKTVEKSEKSQELSKALSLSQQEPLAMSAKKTVHKKERKATEKKIKKGKKVKKKPWEAADMDILSKMESTMKMSPTSATRKIKKDILESQKKSKHKNSDKKTTGTLLFKRFPHP